MARGRTCQGAQLSLQRTPTRRRTPLKEVVEGERAIKGTKAPLPSRTPEGKPICFKYQAKGGCKKGQLPTCADDATLSIPFSSASSRQRTRGVSYPRPTRPPEPCRRCRTGGRLCPPEMQRNRDLLRLLDTSRSSTSLQGYHGTET